MSGTYNTENQDAPNGLGDTVSAVAAGVASAAAQCARDQADAHRFFVENGGDVVSGHADVRTPTNSY
jgi:hypothetical protein